MKLAVNDHYVSISHEFWYSVESVPLPHAGQNGLFRHDGSMGCDL